MVPEDITHDDNDSVLEEQIRLAAMNEKDPEKKKRLWNEYRKYKGLPDWSLGALLLLGFHFSKQKITASDKSSTCINSLSGLPEPQQVTASWLYAFASQNFLIKDAITWLLCWW